MNNLKKNKQAQQLKTKDAAPKEICPFKRVVIREELCALTRDMKDAVLLGQLIYWQSRTGDTDEYLKEEVGRLSKPNHMLKCGWIYKSARVLADEVMLDLAEDAVRRRLKKMVDKGWISERANPVYRYDQKKQYRVNIFIVDAHIRDLQKENGSNAGYYLSCDLMDTARIYIPLARGKESAGAQVVQSAPARNDVEIKEIKNKEAEIFSNSNKVVDGFILPSVKKEKPSELKIPVTLQTGGASKNSSSSEGDMSPVLDSIAESDTNPTLLRTKDESIIEAERFYESFSADYKNDALLCAEDFEAYKRAELKAAQDKLEMEGVEAEEIQNWLRNTANYFNSFDNEIIPLVNSKKEAWLALRRGIYIRSFVDCGDKDLMAVRADVDKSVENEMADHENSHWFDGGIKSLEKRYGIAMPKLPKMPKPPEIASVANDVIFDGDDMFDGNYSFEDDDIFDY